MEQMIYSKKEQKKKIGDTYIQKSACMYAVKLSPDITMESFNVPSVPLVGFCLRHSENRGTDTSVPVINEESEKWTMRIELLEAING